MLSMWLNKVFGRNKKRPETLKEMFESKLISEEEFFRFTIVQKQASLDKAKKALLDFLKKQKK